MEWLLLARGALRGEAVRETLCCLSARLGLPGESQMRAGLSLWVSAR